MAKVRFYGMELDFEFIRSNYIKANFGKFVLQPYMADAEKWKDEFTLLIYALDNKGGVLDKINLKIDKDKIFKAHDRVELGNIPFYKSLLDKFIAEDGPAPGKISSLYFNPYQFGEYVAYKVTSVGSNTLAFTVDGDLKPSPPAPPEEA